MELNSFVSFEDVLFKKFKDFGDRTYAQIYLYRNWPFAKKRQYVGDWSDLEQSLLCGLLEWHRELGKPDRVLEGDLFGKLEEIFEVEVESNCRKERLGEPVVDPEGNWQHWNPTEPDDLISPERAKAIDSLMWSIAHFVGEVPAYILKARLVFNLSWVQIKKRLATNRDRDPDLADHHNAKLLGYPRGHCSMTVEEIEATFEKALHDVRTKAEAGNWVWWKRLINRNYEEESAE